MVSSLYAGFSQVSIGDWVGYRMPGHSARVEPAVEQIDQLKIKAVYFKTATTNVVILLADIVAIDYETEHRINRAVKNLFPEAQIEVVIAATHTHTGPPVFRLGDVSVHEPARSDLVEAGVKAVRIAVREVGLVTKIEVREVPNSFAVNRRLQSHSGVLMQPNFDGPVVRMVTLFSFFKELIDDDSSTGSLLGSLCILPMHPTTLSTSISALSGDVAGALSLTIERRSENTVCLMFQGASGDVRPLITDSDDLFTGGTREDMQAMAHSIAEKLIRKDPAFTLKPRKILYQTRVINFEWTNEQQDSFRDYPSEQTISMITFNNDAAIVFVPGEPFADLSLSIQAQSAYPCTALVGHCNSTVGYIPSATAFDEGGYEVEEAYSFYGFPGPLHRDSGNRLVETVVKILNDSVKLGL